MPDHDDTPPDLNAPGWARRIEKQISGLDIKVDGLHDSLLGIVPKLEDHTGRLRRLETQERAQGTQMTAWKFLGAGFVAALTLVGGTVAALAAAGVLR